MSNNNTMDLNEKVPNEFLCPITLDIMNEPMVMPDGQTYEKEAIKKALEITHVSPLTKMPMNFSDGVINYTLKSLIEKYKEEQGLKDKDNTIKNINIFKDEPVKVEFEELSARFISSDKSANLCKDTVFVSIKPKKVKAAPPVFLVCVVDVSGSMGSNCCQNIENMESMYLTRLDLVKHSLKTIISTLRKQDMIGIIEFNQKAKTVVKPTVLINKDIKDEVIKNLESMEDWGSTNIWDGIKMAIDTCKNLSLENYQKSIMVFTDGDSNINPPKGVYNTLKSTLKATKDNFTISTFSFGNDAGPQLLIDIAQLGNGIYGYCPDGTMVGTIFINYMANLLSTITPVVKVVLSQGEDVHKTVTIGPLYRGTRRNTTFLVNKDLLDQTKISIKLPFLNQEFEVPLNKESFDLQGYINQMLEMKSSNNNDDNGNDNNDNDDKEDEDEILDDEEEESDEDTVVVDIDEIDTNIIVEEKDGEAMNYGDLLYNQILRNKFFLILNKLLKTNNIENDKAKGILNDYFELLKQLKYKTKFVKSLIIDIKDPNPNHGQVDKAIDLQYFYTWGQCYLNSLCRFHQFEQCGNFKDQSLQYYSSEVFEKYRNMANKIFVNLPPPEAQQYNTFDYSINNNNNASTTTTNRNTRVQMRGFLNRHGGCFNGEAIVLLANGMKKFAKDLKKGDCLNNGAMVKCLIEQTSGDNDLSKPYMCDINGVLLTPYHPVSINNQWNFPADLVQAKPVSIKSWFNLVLEDPINQKYEVEFDNGVKAITLGHYRTENSVLKHPYFGTDLVLKDLEERDPQGYSDGYIYIEDFDPRQLQYDENQCCINYYKIQSNTTINNNQIEIINEENAINIIC